MPGDTDAAVHDGRQFERVLWRSRRGMLELDLLLVDFARCRYRALDPADQRAYQELLGFDDWTIFDWLQQPAAHCDAPPRLARILRLIAHGRGLG